MVVRGQDVVAVRRRCRRRGGDRHVVKGAGPSPSPRLGVGRGRVRLVVGQSGGVVLAAVEAVAAAAAGTSSSLAVASRVASRRIAAVGGVQLEGPAARALGVDGFGQVGGPLEDDLLG